ncbi:ABC transporter ATP-binding protein [Rhodoluna sp.]|uniref:ABC transporter ATP-binding protein n=1 Tax=Rhodoluna sp. TaxID=1969481 RepID=UPI0025CD22A3|nr:ABC transporter ATP-binding protein [Rhodoluna sp.]
MIKIADVSFSYKASDSPNLNRVNLQIESGEFVLVCGPTGSGKSTLLKVINGLAPHFTGGKFKGSIKLDEIEIASKLPHELSDKIGFVNQQPESAFVADTVIDELAYGLEQLGVAPAEMRVRIEQIAAQLGIEKLLHQPLGFLSGGQQQRVAIAAALAAGQKVLLLDEPTSALDPQAALEIVKTLKRLSSELGITVLLAEHRIERVVEQVDSVIVVHGDGSVTKGAAREQFNDYRMVPPVIELSQKLELLPLATTAAEARNGIGERLFEIRPRLPIAENAAKDWALKINELSVRYQDEIALQPFTATVNQAQITAIMGPNGSGKTSLLWALQGSGLRSTGTAITPWGDCASMPTDERLSVVAMVPQKASDLLFLNSLALELEESDRFAKVSPATTASLFEKLAGRIDPAIHPRDLSSGQQLALVLAIQLVKGAKILLLDEPTRGLDYAAKQQLADQLIKLRQMGKCIVLASHDVEFVALVADEVIQLAAGQMVFSGKTEIALGAESDLATQVAQICNQPGLLTVAQVVLS